MSFSTRTRNQAYPLPRASTVRGVQAVSAQFRINSGYSSSPFSAARAGSNSAQNGARPSARKGPCTLTTRSSPGRGSDSALGNSSRESSGRLQRVPSAHSTRAVPASAAQRGAGLSDQAGRARPEHVGHGTETVIDIST